MAALAIAVFAFALATPANALTIKTSDCDTALNPTSCYNVDENILSNDAVCNALSKLNTCVPTTVNNTTQNTECITSNCQNTDNNTKNATTDITSTSNKNFNIQSFNNFWTNLLNNFKNGNSIVVNKPSTSEEQPNVTNPAKPIDSPVVTEPEDSNDTPVVTEPDETPVAEEPTTPVDTPVTDNPTTSTGQTSLSAQEQQLVDLINSERVKAGLSPLTIDIELSEVARIKAQDMIDNNYFSHTSPTYGSPFDMMKSFGITFKSAGENIAINSSVQKAHVAFMNSEGHRANILNSSYTHVGIGIASKGGSLYISEMFIGK